MKPGDRVTGDNGMTFVLGDQLAYQGKPGCTDPRCTRRISPEGLGICIGWHCPKCHAPTSSMGHNCPEAIS